MASSLKGSASDKMLSAKTYENIVLQPAYDEKTLRELVVQTRFPAVHFSYAVQALIVSLIIHGGTRVKN